MAKAKTSGLMGKIQKYIKKMFLNELLSECLRQQKSIEEGEKKEEPPWKEKPLHGIDFQQTEEVADIEKSYRWLQKAGLKDSMNTFIAGQGQALSTRVIEATPDEALRYHKN